MRVVIEPRTRSEQAFAASVADIGVAMRLRVVGSGDAAALRALRSWSACRVAAAISFERGDFAMLDAWNERADWYARIANHLAGWGDV